MRLSCSSPELAQVDAQVGCHHAPPGRCKAAVPGASEEYQLLRVLIMLGTGIIIGLLIVAVLAEGFILVAHHHQITTKLHNAINKRVTEQGPSH
jgi:hypothetical protein